MEGVEYGHDAMAIPSQAIGESCPPDGLEGHGDQILGGQEMAQIWRHPELNGVELFRGVYKSYQAARHFHVSPAIGIVAKGAMNTYARGATHTLPSGTVFLINPGEVHAPQPVIPEGWELRAFYFSNDFYTKLSNSFGLQGLRFSGLFVHNQLLTKSLLSLHRSLEQAASRLDVQSRLLSIFQVLARHYAQVPLQDARQKTEHRKIMQAKDFLVGNYRRAITLEELANVVELSPHHLLRTFRSAIGITPHDFLTQIRVEQAMQLMRRGATLSDVAVDTGFVDQAHFTRRFREIMGVTPGRFLSTRTKANSWQLPNTA